MSPKQTEPTLALRNVRWVAPVASSQAHHTSQNWENLDGSTCSAYLEMILLITGLSNFRTIYLDKWTESCVKQVWRLHLTNKNTWFSVRNCKLTYLSLGTVLCSVEVPEQPQKITSLFNRDTWTQGSRSFIFSPDWHFQALWMCSINITHLISLPCGTQIKNIDCYSAWSKMENNYSQSFDIHTVLFFYLSNRIACIQIILCKIRGCP